ncbi:MAG: SusC/RagA family TonB-linked outer membrane protein [Bacteroidota bacterium]
MIRKLLYLNLVFILVGLTVTGSYAQAPVEGTVKDSNGDGLPGVNILLKGTTSGTVTDIDGNFSLIVSEGDVLIFSLVGFATQTITYEGNSLNVILEEDILGLDEVVITGTGGLTEKKQLGNTIATVTGTEITASGAVDPTGSLSGKMAGIQVMQNSGDPAGGVSVRLRSASTVYGDSDPLYIIDGVIVNNNSTNVLNVTSVVQNRLSDISPQDIERVEVIKGAAAAAIYGSRASNGVVQIFTKKGIIGKPKVTFSSSINFNSLRKKRAYNDAPLKWTGGAPDTQTEAVTRYDYQDMFFENSMGTESFVSVTGGNNDTKYYTSISHMKNEGIMLNTDYSRLSGRIKINQKLNDWASFSIGSYISRSHSNDKPNGGYSHGVLQAFLFADNSIDPRADADGNYPAIGWLANPIEIIETFDFQQLNNRSISDFQLNLAPIDGLTINYILGFDNSSSLGTRYIPIGTTKIPTGSARNATINTQMLNSDINAVYDFDISENIKSTTSLGLTWQYEKTDMATIDAEGLGLGVKTTDGAATINTYEYLGELSVWGGYVQQTFGIMDKIFVTGAARIDGASSFGLDERTQFYPKASLSYIISEEQFWNENLGGLFNNFKLRLGWGQSGNLTALGPFDRLTRYGAVGMNGLSGLVYPTRMGNPDLKPERQTEIEFGFDMAMLDNRFGIEFTYYSQDIQDLLLDRTLAPTSGALTRIENVGTMSNTGVEIMINATPVRTSDLRWDLTATFSKNKNEVNGIEGEEISFANFGFTKAKNGYPLGVFKQTYLARNEDGSLLLTADGFPQREKGYVDADGNNVHERDANGQPTGSDLQKVIGDPNPDYIASLISNLTYKQWTFRMQFDAVQGFDILSWDKRMFLGFDGGDQEAKELNGEEIRGYGWQSFLVAESYIEDGSFTKLRELSLSYLLQEPVKGIDNIRFTLSGRNLFSFDKFSSWDPEVNMDAQSNVSRGGVMGLIPIPRVVKFGVTANF